MNVRTILRTATRLLRALLAALTPTGRALCFGVLVATVAGFVLGWPELHVLAGAGLVALVISLASVVGSGVFSVERTLHPLRLNAGEQAIGLLRIRNDGRGRRRAIRAVDRVGRRDVSIDIPPLSAGDSIDLPFTVAAERRGVIPVGPLWIGRADPFGLMRRRHAQGEVLEVLVHPRFTTVPLGGSGWAKDMEGPTTRDSPLGSVAFHSLRDYQPGDDMRHIHWRSSARAGHSIVRQFVDTRRSINLLVLDRRADEYQSPELAELAVEVTASLAVSMLRAGQPTACELGDDRATSNRPVAALDRLAKVQFDGTAELSSVVAAAVDLGGTPTTLVAITGSLLTATTMARVGAAASRATSVVIVQVVPDGVGVVEDRPGRAAVQISSLHEFEHLWTVLGAVRRG